MGPHVHVVERDYLIGLFGGGAVFLLGLIIMSMTGGNKKTSENVGCVVALLGIVIAVGGVAAACSTMVS